MTGKTAKNRSEIRSPMTVVMAAVVLLQPVLAAEYPLPAEHDNVVGAVQIIESRYEDTLSELARRYGLGYEEIVRANPDVDPWMPGEGTTVRLPTRFVLPPGPREGIVLNLPEFRLYYYPKTAPDEEPVVITHPISIGRMDWSTPIGRTEITGKVTNPTWFPPETIRAEHAADGRPLSKVVPPGPQNPLGRRAMSLGIPGYLIHGTNKASGVGMRVTHGCIRMYPENIRELFDQVAVHTPVQIVNVPFKVGLADNTLFLEAHTPLEEEQRDGEPDLTRLTRAVVAGTGELQANVDWDAAEAIYRARLGVPESMGILGAGDGPGDQDSARLSGGAESACPTEDIGVVCELQ